MTDNPMIKVLERISQMAQLHGTVYCKITWDPDKEEFNFAFLLKEYVEVHYRGKAHD